MNRVTNLGLWGWKIRRLTVFATAKRLVLYEATKEIDAGNQMRQNMRSKTHKFVTAKRHSDSQEITELCRLGSS